MRRTLSELEAHSVATVVIRDTPKPSFNPPNCLSRAAWRNLDGDQECAFERRSHVSESVFAIEIAVLAEFETAYAVDMTNLICPGGQCHAQTDGNILYRDSHHLTTTYVELLAAPLFQRLTPIVRSARGN